VARAWRTIRGEDAIESLDALLALREHDQLCERSFPFFHRVEIACPSCLPGPDYLRGPCHFCNRSGRKVLAVGEEELPLLLAIEAEPDDEAPRLIYSDWLEEQGRDQEAEAMKQLSSHAIQIIRPSCPVSDTDPTELPF
jgi:uncharacterized protein (TIGR02996 family)